MHLLLIDHNKERRRRRQKKIMIETTKEKDRQIHSYGMSVHTVEHDTTFIIDDETRDQDERNDYT